jgi:UDP-2,3-diacylglucosamine pyrophosphatase LpxH
MFTENKLYMVGNGKRIYDSDKDGVFEFAYSELCINFYQYMQENTKIFYLVGSSKHTFSLNDSDLNYLYTIGSR